MAKLKITNVTQSSIQIDLTRHSSAKVEPGQLPESPARTLIVLPPMSIQPTVVEGEQADLLMKNSYFQTLVGNGSLVVDRRAGLEEAKATTSNPQPPADLANATKPGATVTQVASMDVQVKKFGSQSV
jgi:hypothetical protein